jgi:hypothetical protein
MRVDQSADLASDHNADHNGDRDRDTISGFVADGSATQSKRHDLWL